MIRDFAAGAALIAASFVLLPACSQSQTPNAPEPRDEADWRDIPLAPGSWVYRRDERGSLALFGAPGGAATFMVRCDSGDRRIVFSRAGSLGGESGTMAFRSTHGETLYPARDAAGEAAYVVAGTTADDEFLDLIAFSRGRIAVSVPGAPLLAIPNWPEMTRVFEDCRG